jgi:hypothetical protein
MLQRYLPALQRAQDRRYRWPTDLKVTYTPYTLILLFKTVVPLQRDLTKLLHQRRAAARWEYNVLRNLATAIVGLVTGLNSTQAVLLRDFPDFANIPVSKDLFQGLLGYLATSNFRSNDYWLRGQSATIGRLQLLEGGTLKALADQFQGATARSLVGRDQRLHALLKKVQKHLDPAEFTFFVQCLETRHLRGFKP